MQLAEDQAHKSSQNFKHGAVLVRNGKVISSGHNKVTTRCPSHMYSVHAEMAAIKQSSSNELKDAQLYVVRVRKCGHVAESRPCRKCQQFMKLHGISRCYFTTDDGFDSMYI